METIIRTYYSDNWTTATLVFAMVFLATARLLKVQGFQDFILLLTSDKYLIMEQKHNKPSFLFHLALTSFQILSVGLFIYLSVSYMKLEPYKENGILLLQIIMAYLLFSIGKQLIERIIGVILSSETLISHYLFCKMSYRNYLGLFLLPINVLLLYTIPPSKTIIIALLILLILGNLLTLFIIYRSHQKVIFENILYFILYLCALEIAPYFVLYKLFEGQLTI